MGMLQKDLEAGFSLQQQCGYRLIKPDCEMVLSAQWLQEVEIQ